MNQAGKILITGGTGFLGAYIIKELVEKGFTVRAIKRKSASWPFFISQEILQKAEWMEGDILDYGSLEDAIQGIDTIIHCAGLVSFSKKDRDQLQKVNVEGTANMVNIALQEGVNKIVYISSVAAIGRKTTAAMVDETAEWQENKHTTTYAISKFRAELEVWRGFAEGLDGVIVNPATLLGYGDWTKGSTAIFKKVYDGLKWYSSGQNAFADVEDTARAIVALMQTDMTEERFIIANDNWSFEKLLTVIANGLQKPAPSKLATPFLSAIAWRAEKMKSIFTGQKPVITKESARVANSNTLFNNNKLLKALPGFRYTPLEETIKKACEKYLQH